MGERAQQGYEDAVGTAFRAQPALMRLKQHIASTLAVSGLALLFFANSIAPLFAETVDVKYRGPVDLASFECTGELDSAVVKRVCYNAANSYMLIRLKATWYHYCEIDAATVTALLDASSKGSFYNASIKDSSTGGKFGCRDKVVPQL